MNTTSPTKPNPGNDSAGRITPIPIPIPEPEPIPPPEPELLPVLEPIVTLVAETAACVLTMTVTVVPGFTDEFENEQFELAGSSEHERLTIELNPAKSPTEIT